MDILGHIGVRVKLEDLWCSKMIRKQVSKGGTESFGVGEINNKG